MQYTSLYALIYRLFYRNLNSIIRNVISHCFNSCLNIISHITHIFYSVHRVVRALWRVRIKKYCSCSQLVPTEINERTLFDEIL